MKVLQVIEVFSPAHGGSAESTYQLSKELAKRGHDVTVFTSDHKLSQQYVDSIPEVRVYSFKAWLSLANFEVTPAIIKSAQREIEHFDVIHMNNYRTFQNVIVHHYARKYGIPYVLQAHGSVLPFFQKVELKRVFDGIWGDRILEDASKLIALTPTEAEQYETMGVDQCRIGIVPNGIDLAEYDTLPQKGRFRRKYSIRENEKMILYLARIHRIKGPELLVRAYASLSREFDGSRLVIVGPDDGYLSTLKRLVADFEIGPRVLITGPLYGKDKLEACIDADVYVLPSIYETFPTTVLEACACGLPVVVTDRCGIADIIDGQVGLVVPYDEKQLSDAILRLLTDGKIRQQFGEKGKALVREKFNWAEIVERLEGIYQGVLTKTT